MPSKVDISEAEEVLQFLSSKAAPNVRSIALEYFLGMTGKDEGIEFISSNDKFLSAIIELTKDPINPIAKDAFFSLINLTTKEDVSIKILGMKEHPDFMYDLLTYILKPDSEYADMVCGILCNLSRSLPCANKLVDLMVKKRDDVGFDKVIQVFCRENYNAKNNMDLIGPFLLNLTQITEARHYILDKEKCVIQRLLAFTSFSGSLKRRQGIVGAIRNCCFELDYHEWLLSDKVDILPRLLLPLAGPEEFDDEDNEKLPDELQYLEPDKERESDPDIRKDLVESIFKLCTLKTCRKIVKDNNTYVIIRELDRWEKDESVKQAIENLIQVLISDEPEPGMENLNEVQIPENVEKKLEQTQIND